MAADSPPPPPPLAPTTITALTDDNLREIFLRLPDVANLARAAFACPAFLHAVRSSPEFRRRFRELHAPPLLALFIPPAMRAIVPADAGKGSGIAADFERLLQDPDSSESEWWSDFSCGDGYVDFFNRATNQWASYKLHSRTLIICPKNFDDGNGGTIVEFHTLSHDGEEQQPSQVVCVHRAWAWARVAVFSAHNMEWPVVLPKMKTGRLLVDYERYGTGTGTGRVVNGFVCWVVHVHDTECILALNTATFQFSRMELPPPMKVPFSMLELGHTKDGEFCVVSVQQCMLSVCLWATDGDGVERFMLHKTFSLRLNVTEITNCSEEAAVRMRPMAVINGFVYLSLSTSATLALLSGSCPAA